MSMGIRKLDPELFKMTRNRFTFTMSVKGKDFEIQEFPCKMLKRPSVNIKEKVDENGIFRPDLTQMIWDPVEISFNDRDVDTSVLYTEWLAKVYDFTDPTNNPDLEIKELAATVTIRLYDGCKNELEKWVIKGAYPKSIDFGDLDFSSNNSNLLINLTLICNNIEYVVNISELQPKKEVAKNFWIDRKKERQPKKIEMGYGLNLGTGIGLSKLD